MTTHAIMEGIVAPKNRHESDQDQLHYIYVSTVKMKNRLRDLMQTTHKLKRLMVSKKEAVNQ